MHYQMLVIVQSKLRLLSGKRKKLAETFNIIADQNEVIENQVAELQYTVETLTLCEKDLENCIKLADSLQAVITQEHNKNTLLKRELLGQQIENQQLKNREVEHRLMIYILAVLLFSVVILITIYYRQQKSNTAWEV